MTQVDRNTFRIMPYDGEPLLFQVSRLSTAIYLGYVSVTLGHPTGPQLWHSLYVLPWANGEIPEVSTVPTRMPEEQVHGEWYPINDQRSIKFVAWNVTGIEAHDVHGAIQNLVTEFNPMMVILMGTELSFARVVQLLTGFQSTGYCYTNHYTEQFGGPWVLWNSAEVDVKVFSVGDGITLFQLLFPREAQQVNPFGVCDQPQPSPLVQASSSSMDSLGNGAQ